MKEFEIIRQETCLVDFIYKVEAETEDEAKQKLDNDDYYDCQHDEISGCIDIDSMEILSIKEI